MRPNKNVARFFSRAFGIGRSRQADRRRPHLLWRWTGWSVWVYRQTRRGYWRVGQVVRSVGRWDCNVVTIERRRNWQRRRIGSIVYCDWLFQQYAIASARALLDCTDFACDRVASDRWRSVCIQFQTESMVISRHFIIVSLFHHFNSFVSIMFN